MIQIFEYENSPIQFEVIDGHVMANATLMAKAFSKKPELIFRTKTWLEFEEAVSEDTKIMCVNLRTSKMGSIDNGGGSWIHQELVIEFARRLNTKFSLWCNRKLADLLRTGTATIETVKPNEIEKHIQRPVQIDNSKAVNTFNFTRGGVERTVEYNQKNCYEHTGKFPNELVKYAKENGVPSKHRTSGKEVVRFYKPETAASMSMTDELCKSGQIDVTKAASLCKPAIPLFREMIKQGLLGKQI